MNIALYINNTSCKNCDIDSLKHDIQSAAKSLPGFDKNEDVKVFFSNGRLFSINGYETDILVSSPSFTKGSGENLVRLKKYVIELLKGYGFDFDESKVFIKSEYIPNLENSLQKNTRIVNETLSKKNTVDEEFDYGQKAKQYVPVKPLYSFDRVIMPKETINKITEAVSILEFENKVFNEWGLYEIQPRPSTALSFYGPSGTGKTMAAEAIAQKLGKKILKVSYADVESKYHGEGPKMVKAIFLAAEKEKAVLFFDEADSLLSKRLTDISSGSEQAINSMRSQLLICLEEYRGIVIFATNLVINYDKAFLTRLISIEFKIPDAETRKKIWDVHIRPADDGKPHSLNIPLSDDVDTAELSEKFEFVGREIRNAVVSACVNAAWHGNNVVAQEDFIKACSKLIDEKEALLKSQHSESGGKINDAVKAALLEKIKEKKEQ